MADIFAGGRGHFYVHAGRLDRQRGPAHHHGRARRADHHGQVGRGDLPSDDFVFAAVFWPPFRYVGQALGLQPRSGRFLPGLASLRSCPRRTMADCCPHHPGRGRCHDYGLHPGAGGGRFPGSRARAGTGHGGNGCGRRPHHGTCPRRHVAAVFPVAGDLLHQRARWDCSRAGNPESA